MSKKLSLALTVLLAIIISIMPSVAYSAGFGGAVKDVGKYIWKNKGDIAKGLATEAGKGAAWNAGWWSVEKMVDWILDPKNNRPRKKATGCGDNLDMTPQQYAEYLWGKDSAVQYEVLSVDYVKYNKGYTYYDVLIDKGYHGKQLNYMRCGDEIDDSKIPKITIEDIAKEIVKRAEAGDTKAQDFVKEAIDWADKNPDKQDPPDDATIMHSDDYTPDPDQSSKPDDKTTTDGNSKDDKTDSDKDKDDKKDDKPFELPKFCDWAGFFCDDPPDKDKDEVEIDDPKIPADSVNINFGGGCPAPKQIPINFAGLNMNMDISFDFMCRLAILISPAVKIAATISAIYILAGRQ